MPVPVAGQPSVIMHPATAWTPALGDHASGNRLDTRPPPVIIRISS